MLIITASVYNCVFHIQGIKSIISGIWFFVGHRRFMSRSYIVCLFSFMLLHSGSCYADTHTPGRNDYCVFTDVTGIRWRRNDVFTYNTKLRFFPFLMPTAWVILEPAFLRTTNERVVPIARLCPWSKLWSSHVVKSYPKLLLCPRTLCMHTAYFSLCRSFYCVNMLLEPTRVHRECLMLLLFLVTVHIAVCYLFFFGPLNQLVE